MQARIVPYDKDYISVQLDEDEAMAVWEVLETAACAGTGGQLRRRLEELLVKVAERRERKQHATTQDRAVTRYPVHTK